MELNSLPKIYSLGTKYNVEIFEGAANIFIQEKVDGSQFSFKFQDGVLACRSKGTLITGDPGMFKQAVETATRLASEGLLINGWHYQCEYLQKPKHNVLCYQRHPKGHLVLFDIRMTDGTYISPMLLEEEAFNLGIEATPVLFCGSLSAFEAPERIAGLLDKQSFLGGPLEGVVVKNYYKQHPERPGHPMTAKIVRPEFKEKHSETYVRNPKAGTDQIQAIINSLRTEARYLKAIQHLKEQGTLVNENRDIGLLITEIQRDVLEEEGEWIKQELLLAFQKDILKGVCNGFAQFYQKLLVDGMTAFQEQQATQSQSV